MSSYQDWQVSAVTAVSIGLNHPKQISATEFLPKRVKRRQTR